LFENLAISSGQEVYVDHHGRNGLYLETRDIRTKIAPNIVTLLPENSLPNSKPRPSPGYYSNT